MKTNHHAKRPEEDKSSGTLVFIDKQRNNLPTCGLGKDLSALLVVACRKTSGQPISFGLVPLWCDGTLGARLDETKDFYEDKEDLLIKNLDLITTLDENQADLIIIARRLGGLFDVPFYVYAENSSSPAHVTNLCVYGRRKGSPLSNRRTRVAQRRSIPLKKLDF